MAIDPPTRQTFPNGGRAAVGRWASKGFWAILDQGLFAISNFGLNVLLARWLTPGEYGAFAVAYALFLLLGTLHTGLFTEPMLVFGPGKFGKRVGKYLRVLLRGHWAFTAITAALLGATALVTSLLDAGPLTPALWGLAGASPFILFQWLMRRACYIKLQPRLAAVAGSMYLGTIIVGAMLLQRQGWLAAPTALGLMGLASLVSAYWLVRRLAAGEPLRRQRHLSLVRRVVTVHWQYGRWAVGGSALSWAAGSVPYLVLPVTHGLEAVALLRAAFNFVMPILQVFTALGSIVLPVLVQAARKGTVQKVGLLILGLYVVLALAYDALLLPFQEPLRALVYGSNYAGVGSIVAILAVQPFAAAATAVATGLLRAIERPRAVFWAYAASTTVALSAGVAIIVPFGVRGAAATMILVASTTAVAAFGILRRQHLGQTASNPASTGRA